MSRSSSWEVSDAVLLLYSRDIKIDKIYIHFSILYISSSSSYSFWFILCFFFASPIARRRWKKKRRENIPVPPLRETIETLSHHRQVLPSSSSSS